MATKSAQRVTAERDGAVIRTNRTINDEPLRWSQWSQRALLAAALPVVLLLALACGRSPLVGAATGELTDGRQQASRPVCGDGQREGRETCDGDDLANVNCSDLGFAAGVLRCDDDCDFDLDDCSEPSTPEDCEPRVREIAGLQSGCAADLCACAPGAVAACDSDCMETLSCILDRCNGLDSGPACIMRQCTAGSDAKVDAVAAVLPCMTANRCGLMPFDWTWLLCGNGQLDAFETCDADDFGGGSCADYGLTGTLYCNSSCMIDPRSCSGGNATADDNGRCGDGVKAPLEECEGDDFGPITCASFGLTGDLRCSPFCSIDVSSCDPTDTCGDGVLGPTEQCDGTQFRSSGCESIGLMGTLRCDRQCHLDLSDCKAPQRCGNGVREGEEECDGKDTGGRSCRDYEMTGELTCTPFCTYDFAYCDRAAICGDGSLSGDEECDGSDTGAATCAALGYAGGKLKCNPDCTLRTDDCVQCGDGRKDPEESCEPGGDFERRCATYDLGSGVIACDPTTCQLDTSQCEGANNRCGNGVVEVGEQCEGDTRLPCRRLGLAGESAACDASRCIWSTTTCSPLPRDPSSCGTCADTYCAEQLDECTADQSCQAAIACIHSRCGPETRNPKTCSAACDITVDIAGRALSALDCVRTRCGEACVGQDPPQ